MRSSAAAPHEAATVAPQQARPQRRLAGARGIVGRARSRAAILSLSLRRRRGRSGRRRRRGAGVWRRGFGPDDAMISAAQLLDELMGRDRNLAPDEKRSNVRWDHESVSGAGPPLPSPPALLQGPAGSEERGPGPASPPGATAEGQGWGVPADGGVPKAGVGAAGPSVRPSEAAALLHGGRGAGSSGSPEVRRRMMRRKVPP